MTNLGYLLKTSILLIYIHTQKVSSNQTFHNTHFHFALLFFFNSRLLITACVLKRSMSHRHPWSLSPCGTIPYDEDWLLCHGDVPNIFFCPEKILYFFSYGAYLSCWLITVFYAVYFFYGVL